MWTSPLVIPHRWLDERYDLIWVLVRQPGDELAYRFVVVPQMLLADDLETGKKYSDKCRSGKRCSWRD